VVFNIDLYKTLAMKALGMRSKRHIYRKEVIIEDPKYAEDAKMLENVNSDIYQYTRDHKLLHWPSPIKVFFRAGDDQRIEEINTVLETAIDDLSYSTDKLILNELNNYPIVSPSAHTRPFRKKWLNIITGLLLPVGIIMYIRMIRFRLRLYHDLRTIRHTSDRIIAHIYNNKV
jgi:lipopolysaccharide export system permease protein